MFKRIGGKLILLVGATAITIVGLFAYLSLEAMDARLLGEVERHANQLSETVRASTRYAMLLNERDHIRQIVHSISQQQDIGKVRILNKAGEIIYSSIETDIGMMVDKDAEACYSCHSADRPLERLPIPQRNTANQLVHYDEARVGEALLQLATQGITRDKLFLQTKFTPINGQDHHLPYDARARVTTQVQQSFASSLAHLHTDYLDSYVLHGPYSLRGLGAEDWEVWAAIESLYDAGKTKMIGVSNVTADQLTLLCMKAKNKPMMVQNRCYAAFGWDKEVREICQTHHIIYQGFSLLTANRDVFINPEIRAMVARYDVTLAQLFSGLRCKSACCL